MKTQYTSNLSSLNNFYSSAYGCAGNVALFPLASAKNILCGASIKVDDEENPGSYLINASIQAASAGCKCCTVLSLPIILALTAITASVGAVLFSLLTASAIIAYPIAALRDCCTPSQSYSHI